MQDQDAPDLQKQIQLTLQDDQPLDSAAPDLTALRAYLKARISHLLEHNLERLAGIMYRLDVPEKAFHDAMRLPDESRASVLAELVLQRENQRLIFRRKYSNPPTDA